MFYACARKGENGVFVDYGELKLEKGLKGVWKIEKGFGTGDYKNLTAKGSWEMLLSDGKVLLDHSKVNAPMNKGNLTFHASCYALDRNNPRFK